MPTEPGQQIAHRKFIDAGQRGQSEDNVRSVLGIVSTQTGATIAGLGFTVALVSAGQVIVTWAKAFTRVPTISVGCDAQGGGARLALLGSVTTTSVLLSTFDILGNLNGGNVHFRAEAPW